MIHNDLINIGLIACCLILGGGALIMMSPWLKRKFKILTLRVRIVFYGIKAWAIRKRISCAKSSLRRREQRRMRVAMKVFDKPLTRWCDK